MPSWKADQYLKFAAERTQPSRDLAARVAVGNPRRVIDLGCGPGNSTEVLAERWPLAEVTGLDSSAEMIEKARATHPEWRWLAGAIEEWADGERWLRRGLLQRRDAVGTGPPPRVPAVVGAGGGGRRTGGPGAGQLPCRGAPTDARRGVALPRNRARGRMVRPWEGGLLSPAGAPRGPRRLVDHRV